MTEAEALLKVMLIWQQEKLRTTPVDLEVSKAFAAVLHKEVNEAYAYGHDAGWQDGKDEYYN